MAAYAQALGVGAPSIDRSKSWTVYVCGTERLSTATWLVKELFSGVDLASVYPIFSGYSHGELFALLREFELVSQGNFGAHYRGIVNEDTIKGAVAVAAYALYSPAERLSELYGLM